MKTMVTRKHAIGVVNRLLELDGQVLRDRPSVPYPTEDPDEIMVGFVPILPANRDRGLIKSDGERAFYTPEYRAHYYALRDAIERDQYDRRGGYRLPYEQAVTLFLIYVYEPSHKPLHTTHRSRYDLDNCAKTYFDAFTRTSRAIQSNQRVQIHHIQDDSLITRFYTAKYERERGELIGTWYALKATDYSLYDEEEIGILRRAIDKERARQNERREFDLTNLHIAERDGQAFLNDQECMMNNLIDPTLKAPQHPHKIVTQGERFSDAPKQPEKVATNTKTNPTSKNRRRKGKAPRKPKYTSKPMMWHGRPVF